MTAAGESWSAATGLEGSASFVNVFAGQLMHAMGPVVVDPHTFCSL